MISRIDLLSKMELIMIKVILDLEITLCLALTANRWHTQIRIIWGGFIGKATSCKSMGKGGRNTRTRVYVSSCYHPSSCVDEGRERLLESGRIEH